MRLFECQRAGLVQHSVAARVRGMEENLPTGLADATTNELLAMLELMFMAAVADSHFSPEERRHFLEHAEALSGNQLDSTMLARLVASWEKRDLHDDVNRLRELARDLPDKSSRRIAFGLVYGVVRSDGQLAASEEKRLAEVAEVLGLSLAESDEIKRGVKLSEFPSAPA